MIQITIIKEGTFALKMIASDRNGKQLSSQKKTVDFCEKTILTIWKPNSHESTVITQVRA